MNMRLLIICLMLTITGIAKSQDSSCWKLKLNHKIVRSGNLKKAQQLLLSYKEKGVMRLTFNCDKHSENINRSFLIMDQNRKELFRLSKEKNKDYVLISLDKIKEFNDYKPLEIYTVYTPNDSLQAQTWRVKPILLTTITWQQ